MHRVLWQAITWNRYVYTAFWSLHFRQESISNAGGNVWGTGDKLYTFYRDLDLVQLLNSLTFLLFDKQQECCIYSIFQFFLRVETTAVLNLCFPDGENMTLPGAGEWKDRHIIDTRWYWLSLCFVVLCPAPQLC